MQAGTPSPLVAIKQKELELAAEIATTKQTAQREIERARQWAATHVRHAEHEARDGTAIQSRTALQGAEAEAKTIRAEGERTAALVAQQGQSMVAHGVREIVALVLPSPVHAASSDGVQLSPTEETYA